MTRTEIFALLNQHVSDGIGSMLPGAVVDMLRARHPKLKKADPQLLALRVVAWQRGEAA
jgi:hypothetical protein